LRRRKLKAKSGSNRHPESGLRQSSFK
jgi:hypothetical protein